MKKTNYFLAFGILGLFLFAACKKDNNGPVLTTKEKTLSGKTWKLKSITVPKKGDAAQDSSIAKECSVDALFTFDAFKNFQIKNPGTCDSTIINYEKGTWALSTLDSLTLNGAKKKFVWKITILNDSIVKATYRDSSAPDKNWLKTITLKK